MRHAHAYLIDLITLGDFPAQDSLSSSGRAIAKLVTNRRAELKSLSKNQTHSIAQFRLAQSQSWRDLNSAQTRYSEVEALADSLYLPEQDILSLDIGGEGCITVGRPTLLRHPDSALAAMFSGRHQLPTHKGKIFIDRNYRSFARMISYLRTGHYPLYLSPMEDQELKAELDYWGVPWELSPPESPTPPVLSFDAHRSSSYLQFQDDYQTAIKPNSEHAVLCLSQLLTCTSPNLSFQVTLNNFTEDTYQVILGLTPDFHYQGNNSNLWLQLPNSYFWDVDENRLLLTDACKRLTECSDYGCFCEEEDCIFGIGYEPQHQSISFYKNGICQGTAFTRVTLPLSVVLELRFDKGVVRLNLDST